MKKKKNGNDGEVPGVVSTAAENRKVLPCERCRTANHGGAMYRCRSCGYPLRVERRGGQVVYPSAELYQDRNSFFVSIAS